MSGLCFWCPSCIQHLHYVKLHMDVSGFGFRSILSSVNSSSGPRHGEEPPWGESKSAANTVIVRRVRGKMDKFVVVQRKRKSSSSRERDFSKRDRNDTSSCSESANQGFSSENDISNFVGVPLTDADRQKVLFNCWSLPSGFSFPYVTVGAQNRSFQKQVLNEFTWLAYSDIYNGAFCKWCFVFAPQTDSGAKPPGSLVSGPHCNYKKAKEHYNNHHNCHYHKLCADMFDNFVQTDADKSRDVRNALNSSRHKAVEENRNRPSHIIRTIEFCGRQEILLRGHRDTGAFSMNETDCNDAVFKAALRLRVEASDKQTPGLFLKASRNASYLRWRVQNQIMSLMGDAIQKQILSDISQCKYFLILADETTDVSQTEQVTLSVRFIEDTKVHEELLCFVPVSSTTDKDLAFMILTQLSQLVLNLEHMRGQGYDGASNMSGKYRGGQARVKELYPLAIYTHCCNHVLNLVISTSSQLPVIRNAMATISDICVFLSRSAQGVSTFHDNVEREVSGPASSLQKLKPICATRWVERYDSIIIFVTLLPAVVSALEGLQWENKQVEVATNAATLLNCVQRCTFLIVALVMQHTSGIILPVLTLLQNKELDIFAVVEHTDSVLDILRQNRSNCENVFHKIFDQAKNECEEYDSALLIPRRCKKEIFRDNYPSEHFFREAIFVPYLDHFIVEMVDRFLVRSRSAEVFGA